MTRALLIAAPRSGAGKTTLTLALAAALRARGLVVRTAKSGPDYIDPAYHAAATGMPSPNLDSWAMPPALLDAMLADAAADADLLLVESAMGLFDGLEAPPGGRGAAADLAARYGLPVLLVLDVSGQSQSAAAIARGFAVHEAGVRVAGVVLNRVASERHHAQVAAAMARAGLPVLGSLPRAAAVALPERHLGLIQAQEVAALAAVLRGLADLAERHCDLDAILAAAATLPAPAAPAPGACCRRRASASRSPPMSPSGSSIRTSWPAGGAPGPRSCPSRRLPTRRRMGGATPAWLPGGYPELHAGRLAASANDSAPGWRRSRRGGPVHGECGGFMVLGQGWRTRRARAMPWSACSATPPASPAAGCISATGRRRCWPTVRSARPARGCAGTSSTTPACSTPAPTRRSPPSPTRPAARCRKAAGGVGLVSGSFFHAIAQEAS